MAPKKNNLIATKNKAKNLVVVESPAKARTISRILGSDYTIAASKGHVRDLPKGKLGIDVDQDFAPSYSVMRTKSSVVKELKALGKNADAIYLATDPDREGEAISWHLVNATGWDKEAKQLRRVVFHEITEPAIKEAFEHARDLDQDLINAQQARRILDRLVGYQLSPLLWKKVQRGLSAGRVQSVALRLVVEREREVEAFIPREHWSIEATLAKEDLTFPSTVHSIKGEKKKLEIIDEGQAKEVTSQLEGASYSVSRTNTSEKRRRPYAPFTTSTLQQESGRKLRFSAKRTMVLAQQLYEGLSVGDEGPVGLITYMRTDSTSLASSAVAETRKYITTRFGEDYLPNNPRIFKTKSKGAQEAHESIRPTSINRTPESLKTHLNNDQMRLYDLIWSRMLACQMADYIYDATTVDIEASTPGIQPQYILRATGIRPKFLGFTVIYDNAVYMEGADSTSEEDSPLPSLDKGDALRCLDLVPKQHFTQPPPRYSEAALVKALEENGIGRPSTYAPILSTLVDRNYVIKERNRLQPTVLGITVSDQLTEHFPNVMDIDFTANMETELDDIARGSRQWVPMLASFYGPFKETLDAAQENMKRVKVEEPTDEICDECSNPMVIKTGRFGRFIACSTFPDCRNTKPIVKRTGAECPNCSGDIVERKSKSKGRVFYGCSNYPTCDFSVVRKPLPEPCPECGGLMVTSRQEAQCTKCAWQGEPTMPVTANNEL
ncbi:type I DNA topoisomerase [SAR202 cluster bacterium AD-804-J14_MRT_500m]|nr:type I DNA topoisomerase [SAR202 cluster bacterium AD-804-J14_MRT_500m]